MAAPLADDEDMTGVTGALLRRSPHAFSYDVSAMNQIKSRKVSRHANKYANFKHKSHRGDLCSNSSISFVQLDFIIKDEFGLI